MASVSFSEAGQRWKQGINDGAPWDQTVSALRANGRGDDDIAQVRATMARYGIVSPAGNGPAAKPESLARDYASSILERLSGGGDKSGVLQAAAKFVGEAAGVDGVQQDRDTQSLVAKVLKHVIERGSGADLSQISRAPWPAHAQAELRAAATARAATLTRELNTNPGKLHYTKGGARQFSDAAEMLTIQKNFYARQDRAIAAQYLGALLTSQGLGGAGVPLKALGVAKDPKDLHI